VFASRTAVCVCVCIFCFIYVCMHFCSRVVIWMHAIPQLQLEELRGKFLCLLPGQLCVCVCMYVFFYLCMYAFLFSSSNMDACDSATAIGGVAR
jgi:hypothetical protein